MIKAERGMRNLKNFSIYFRLHHLLRPTRSQQVALTCTPLETARTAHGAVVARLAARVKLALLLVLEEINQLGHCGLIHAEPILAGMRRGNVDTAQPWRAHTR